MQPTIDDLFTAIGELDADRVSDIVPAARSLAHLRHNDETALTLACMMATSELALPTIDGGERFSVAVLAPAVAGQIHVDAPACSDGRPQLAAGAAGTPLYLSHCAFLC